MDYVTLSKLRRAVQNALRRDAHLRDLPVEEDAQVELEGETVTVRYGGREFARDCQILTLPDGLALPFEEALELVEAVVEDLRPEGEE